MSFLVRLLPLLGWVSCQISCYFRRLEVFFAGQFRPLHLILVPGTFLDVWLSCLLGRSKRKSGSSGELVLLL